MLNVRRPTCQGGDSDGLTAVLNLQVLAWVLALWSRSGCIAWEVACRSAAHRVSALHAR